MYSIGQFSKLTGLSIYALCYYEEEGLLTPKRNQANQRIYDDMDLTWLDFVLRLKAVNMPVKEIKVYADLRQRGNSTYLERMTLLENP